MTFNGLAEIASFCFNNYPKKMSGGKSIKDPDYLPHITLFDKERNEFGFALSPFE